MLIRFLSTVVLFSFVLPIFAEEATKPKTVKVAAVQCSSDLGQVRANRKKLTAFVEDA
jgi:hypothetical protein